MKKQLIIIGIIVLLVAVGLSGCSENVSDYVSADVYYGGYLYKVICPCPGEEQLVFILTNYNTSEEATYLVKSNVSDLEAINKEYFYTEEDIGTFSDGQHVYITGEEATGWAEGINKNSTNFIKVFLVDKILSEEEYKNR